MLDISEITDADCSAVIALWERCGLTRAWNDPAQDIAFARASPNATILVGRVDGAIVASVMAGHDGHRGTVYYVGVDPACQGDGLGAEIMLAAETWLSGKGVWKINLIVRNMNEQARGFYEKLGYAVEPNTQMGKRLDGDS